MTDLWQCTHACAAARACVAAHAARAEARRHARSKRARAWCKRARRTWERKKQKREQGRVQSLAARVAVGRRALSECMQGRFHKHPFTSRFMELPTRSPTKTCKWLRKRAPCMHSKRCPPSPLACGKSTPRLYPRFSRPPPRHLRACARVRMPRAARTLHARHTRHARAPARTPATTTASGACAHAWHSTLPLCHCLTHTLHSSVRTACNAGAARRLRTLHARACTQRRAARATPPCRAHEKALPLVSKPLWPRHHIATPVSGWALLSLRVQYSSRREGSPAPVVGASGCGRGPPASCAASACCGCTCHSPASVRTGVCCDKSHAAKARRRRGEQEGARVAACLEVT